MLDRLPHFLDSHIGSKFIGFSPEKLFLNNVLNWTLLHYLKLYPVIAYLYSGTCIFKEKLTEIVGQCPLEKNLTELFWYFRWQKYNMSHVCMYKANYTYNTNKNRCSTFVQLHFIACFKILRHVLFPFFRSWKSLIVLQIYFRNSCMDWVDTYFSLLKLAKNIFMSSSLQRRHENVFENLSLKFHIFWEGHKILWNLHLTFDCVYCGQNGEDFAKFLWPSQNI